MAPDPRHPDANRWSAYFGGHLGRRERRELLRHAGECAECRRVFAALGSMMAAPAARPAAWSWLAARWDAPLALAASVLLVAGGAWWAQRMPRAVSAPAVAAATAPHAARLLSATAAVLAPAPPRRLAARLRPAPPPSDWEPVAASLPGYTRVASIPSYRAEVQPSLDFTPLMTGFQDQPQMASAPFELAAWNGNADAPHVTLASNATLLPAAAADEVAPSATLAAFASGFASGGPAVPAAVRRGPLAPAITSGLGWAISHGGQLLRSLGAGVWEAVPLVPGVHLRALASAGDEVWAAASTDQVFTSSDNGAHWHQVALPAAGAKTAEVRSINLADAQHVVIVASDGHRWLTADGGATWTQE